PPPLPSFPTRRSSDLPTMIGPSSCDARIRSSTSATTASTITTAATLKITLPRMGAPIVSPKGRLNHRALLAFADVRRRADIDGLQVVLCDVAAESRAGDLDSFDIPAVTGFSVA